MAKKKTTDNTTLACWMQMGRKHRLVYESPNLFIKKTDGDTYLAGALGCAYIGMHGSPVLAVEEYEKTTYQTTDMWNAKLVSDLLKIYAKLAHKIDGLHNGGKALIDIELDLLAGKLK